MAGGRMICLRGGLMWTGEGANLLEGAILIRDRHVVSIVSNAAVEDAARDADEVVDVSGMLLMPPLFDCHVHSNSTLLRGTENSLPLELWSYYAINYGRGLTDRAIRVSSLLTDVEMIRNGIGGYIDHFPQAHRSMSALAAHCESGLRVGFAPFFADLRDEDILDMAVDRDVVAAIASAAPRRVDEVRANYRVLDAEIRNSGSGRITLLAGPNSPQRCSSDLWTLWRELQDGLGIGSHTHFLETFPQSRAAWRRWPEGPVRALRDADLLHEGVSLSHAIWVEPAERDLIASSGATIAYNPISNGMLGSGRKVMRTDLDAGLRVALGTDCSNTGGRHDLFEVMRHMLISGRDPGSDFATWLKPEEVLTAASSSGAKALNLSPKSGLLAPGALADILVVNLQTFGLAASARNLNSIVVHGDSRNVEALMVDGKWLLRNGRIETIDEAAVISEAVSLAEELRSAASERNGKIEALHGPYMKWQGTVFDTCPCGVHRRS